MTQYDRSTQSNQTKPLWRKSFWIEWILANCIGAGFGLGMPILVAEISVESKYSNYIVAAVVCCAVCVSVSQWLVIRKIVPISAWWILVSFLSPVFSFILLAPLIVSTPPLLPLIFVVYPLLLSLTQWWIFRQVLRPCWVWIIASFFSVIIAGLVGVIAGVFSHMGLGKVGIATAIAGVCYGLTYSAIAGFTLRYMVRQENVFLVTKSQSKSALDVPPDTNLGKYQALSIGLYVVLAGIWFYLFPFPSTPSRGLGSLILDLLFIYIYTYTFTLGSVLIHELGHLLFGLANGFQLKHFVVRKLALVRRGNKFKFKRLKSQFAGGFVLPIPRSLDVLHRRLILMLLGGPAGSFFSFCLGLTPLLVPGLVSKSFIFWFIVFTSSYNLYLTILNLLPIRFGYLTTDGRKILDLIQNNEQGKIYAAFHAINASAIQGIRPRDIAPELIDGVLEAAGKTMERVSGLMIAYGTELDRGNFDRAGEYLDLALELHLYYPQIYRGTIFLEGAYFEAQIRARADVARQWFDKITDTALIEPFALLRAEAALLFAEGDIKAAQIKAEQGLVSTQRDRFFPGSVIAENEYLQSLLDEIVKTDTDESSVH